MSSASLGMSPLTVKRTGTFPDRSRESVFGWSGSGCTEDVTGEQGGKGDISGLITTETYGVPHLHFTKNIILGGPLSILLVAGTRFWVITSYPNYVLTSTV